VGYGIYCHSSDHKSLYLHVPIGINLSFSLPFTCHQLSTIVNLHLLLLFVCRPFSTLLSIIFLFLFTSKSFLSVSLLLISRPLHACYVAHLTYCVAARSEPVRHLHEPGARSLPHPALPLPALPLPARSLHGPAPHSSRPSSRTARGNKFANILW
jgi:hypothetical protein